MNVEIPSFLSHLKVDGRGYPIPFFVAYVNGQPDFRMIDQRKMELCIEKKLCEICGKKLHEHFYFITGPMGYSNGTHSDPPMHKECAEYSINTCPHLHFHKAKANERGEHYKEALSNNIAGIRQKPDTLYLIKADKFKMVYLPGSAIIKFRSVSARQFTYTDNILIETK